MAFKDFKGEIVRLLDKALNEAWQLLCPFNRPHVAWPTITTEAGLTEKKAMLIHDMDFLATKK
ncbi:hypothetical protein N7490_003141 [Penicillium lividum]|nr:hypothetical protein N7490_003141 [Penicillium lividum]